MMTCVLMSVGVLVAYILLTLAGRVLMKIRYNSIRKAYGLEPKPILDGLLRSGVSRSNK